MNEDIHDVFHSFSTNDIHYQSTYVSFYVYKTHGMYTQHVYLYTSISDLTSSDSWLILFVIVFPVILCMVNVHYLSYIHSTFIFMFTERGCLDC